VFIGPAIHEQHVEEVRHVAGIGIGREQLVHELEALVFRVIGKVRAGLVVGWDDASQVDVDAAQEFIVRGPWRRRFLQAFANVLVDPLMKWRLRDGDVRNKNQCHARNSERPGHAATPETNQAGNAIRAGGYAVKLPAGLGVSRTIS
jgi:hypothetical protein